LKGGPALRFADRAEVEIVIASGVLRVSVRPHPKPFSLLMTAAVIIFFVAMSILSWRQSALVERILEIAAVVGGAFGLLQQVSGSEEEIEIGERGIRISREIFGWNKISEFPTEQCSDLDLQTDKEDSRQLQFRLGKWRTIEFGNYMSKDQAEKVLDTLADSFSELARKLLPSLDITKHWTTLNLN
jgi:hypothetical protein